MAYKAYNVYDTATSTIDNFNTLTDPNASTLEKANALADSASALAGVPKGLRTASGKLGSKFGIKSSSKTASNSKVADKTTQPEAKGSDRNTQKSGESQGGGSKSENRNQLAKDEKSNTNYTFRGDDIVDVDKAFQEGIKSKGDSKDLFQHALSSDKPPSNYVSTSKAKEIADTYGNNVYVVRPSRGIDVNKELGDASPFPFEEEIAIPNKINAEDIRAITIDDVSILNPNFEP